MRTRPNIGIRHEVQPSVPRYYYRTPHPPLDRFIALLWFYEGGRVEHSRERMLPSATTELVIDVGGQPKSSAAAIVVGPHSKYWTLAKHEASSVIGVHFKAGGATPFFRVPTKEIHNAQVSLGELWGANSTGLVERILAAPNAEAKFDLLEQALSGAAQTFDRPGMIDFSIRALSSPNLRSVAEVASAVGISQRRFLERFRSEVGLAPKLFARVERFQRVVERVHPCLAVDWAEIAAECGYFDQAHLIHDFKSLTGFTPASYLTRKGSALNHVALTD